MEFDFERMAVMGTSLLILLGLSLYASAAWRDQYPPTIQLLDNPDRYENHHVRMRGTLTGYEMGDEVYTLTLQRYGKSYEVRASETITRKIGTWENGDVIDLLGEFHLSSRGYTEAVKIKHRPRERHERMFQLSLAGLLVLLVFLVKNRKNLLEALPFG